MKPHYRRRVPRLTRVGSLANEKISPVCVFQLVKHKFFILNS